MFYEMIGYATEGHAPETDRMRRFDPAGAALFLDFDGCLVELAETPGAVVVPEDLGPTLARLHAASDGAVALVSGRAVADLRGFLPDFPGVIVGSHGAEIDRGDGPAHTVDPDPERVEALQRMVQGFAASDPAYIAEAKPTGIVLHFRRNPELRGAAWHMLDAAMAEFPGFHIHHSKMAFEIRPDGVGKERAVETLLAEPPFRGRMPVFFGDDVTDEPAMEFVRGAGGISVKVGEGQTCAECRLPDPAAARAALRSILEG